MSTKQESVSDATFKAWPFSSKFNFASKHGQVTTATCKYCPSVVGLILLPTVAKSCILNIVQFLDLSLKTSPCIKTSQFLCENQSF